MVVTFQVFHAAAGEGKTFRVVENARWDSRGVADVGPEGGPRGVQVDPGVTGDDLVVASAVRAALESAENVRSGRIVVGARGGTVTLSGMAETTDARSQAEYLAGRVGGATKVINNLRVRGRAS